MIENTQTPEKPAKPQKFGVNFGGAVFRFDQGTTKEQVLETLKTFRKSDRFDRIVDKESGAPTLYRALADELQDPTDKLKTIKNFYPDADFYGEDNFIFKDPESGKFTLFNPTGFDVGDVAGYARTGFQIAGSTIGAAVGGTGGAVVGPAGAISGGVALAGVGNVVGGQAFDAVTSLFMGREKDLTPKQKALEIGAEFVTGAAGEKIGRMIAPAISKIKKPLEDRAKMLARNLLKINSNVSEIPLSVFTGSKPVAMLEAGVQATPAGAFALEKSAKNILQKVETAAGKVAQDIAGSTAKAKGLPSPDIDLLDEEDIGRLIAESAEQAGETLKSKASALYDEAFDAGDKDALVEIPNTLNLLKEYKLDAAKLSQVDKSHYNNALTRMAHLKAHSNNGSLTFDMLHVEKKNLGKTMQSMGFSESDKNYQAISDRLYSSLMDDLSTAARRMNPEFDNKLKTADAFFKEYKRNAAVTFDEIIKKKSHEKVFDLVMGYGRKNAQAIRNIKQNFKPEQWDVVVGGVFNKLGKSNRTGKFSVDVLISNYGNLSKAARKELFSSPQHAETKKGLDVVIKLSEELKKSAAVRNTSNTSNALHTSLMLGALGVGVGSFATTGDPTDLAFGVLAGVVAPYTAGRLLRSPSFVKWLATPITDQADDVLTHMGRLSAIALAEPQIKGELFEFASALRERKEYTSGVGQETEE